MNIFWVLILVGGVFLFMRYFSRTRAGDGGHGWFGSSPFEILKERYARGEIDRAEFEQMKRDLEETA